MGPKLKRAQADAASPSSAGATHEQHARWWQGLQGQVSLILFFGIGLALVLAAGLIALERNYDWRETWVAGQAERISAALVAVENAEEFSWPAVAHGLSSPLSVFRVGPARQSAIVQPDTERVRYLLTEVRIQTGREVVLVKAPRRNALPGADATHGREAEPGLRPRSSGGHDDELMPSWAEGDWALHSPVVGASHGAAPLFRRIWLAVPMRQGSWLYVRLALEPPPPPSWWAVLSASLLVLAVTAMAVRWAVRRAVAPVQALSAAAGQLAMAAGTGVDHTRLPERGPREAREAARAFNQMQARVADLLSERVQVLGALAHDLQTPITRMRLRLEEVGDRLEPQWQARMEADLQEMHLLVREGLSYARQLHQGLNLRPTDWGALLDAMVDDWQEQGVDVVWRLAEQDANLAGQGQGLQRLIDPVAMRRVLNNLIDNAQRYGQAPIELSLGTTVPAGLVLAPEEVGLPRLWLMVRDHGPGLPAGDWQRVLKPFERGERSRNRQTGGTGLGLAIVEQVVRQHDGLLCLDNHSQGGLRVCIGLPELAPPQRSPTRWWHSRWQLPGARRGLSQPWRQVLRTGWQRARDRVRRTHRP